MKKIVSMILCICMFIGLAVMPVSADTYRNVREGRDTINRINVAPYAEAGTYPEPPEGKVFAGWFTDFTCTAPYTEKTGLAYAKFVEPGQLMDVAPYKSTGTTPEAPDILLRFAGWFVDEACTAPYTADTGMAYAKFIYADVRKMEVSSYCSGSYPIDSNHEMFAGWFVDAECTVPYTAKQGKAYAKFVDIAPMQEVAEYYELGENPEAPEGTIFAGWYADDAYTVPYTDRTGAAYPRFLDVGLTDSGFMDVEPFKTVKTYPEAPEGKVFAGWYTDETCTVPYMEQTGKAYPKYIDADVMNHAFQLRAGTTEESETTDLRIITTVDSTDYQYVRFRVRCSDGFSMGTTLEVNIKTTTAYRKLCGVRSDEVLEYEPTLFSEDSKYFVAINIMNIPNKFFREYYHVYLYYVTADGTEVAAPKNAYNYWGNDKTSFSVRNLIRKINQ